MYLNRANDEDKEMVESWKEDANGMLTFVRRQNISHSFAYNVWIIDWSILCRGRGIARVVRPKSFAEPTNNHKFLSRTYLSTTEWDTAFHPVELIRPQSAIHDAWIGRLGQRALVLESGHEPDLRSLVHLTATVGASLSKGGLPTLQPPQASAYSCVLQERSR